MDAIYWTRTIFVVYVVLFSSNAHYMNQWAVEVDKNEEVEEVAKDSGCENKGKYLIVNSSVLCTLY